MTKEELRSITAERYKCSNCEKEIIIMILRLNPFSNFNDYIELDKKMYCRDCYEKWLAKQLAKFQLEKIDG